MGGWVGGWAVEPLLGGISSPFRSFIHPPTHPPTSSVLVEKAPVVDNSRSQGVGGEEVGDFREVEIKAFEEHEAHWHIETPGCLVDGLACRIIHLFGEVGGWVGGWVVRLVHLWVRGWVF